MPGFALGPGIFSTFAAQGELDRFGNQRFLLMDMALIESPEVDAIYSSFILSYQGSSWLSGRFEIPYVSVENHGDQRYDFGDLTLRFLARIHGGGGETPVASIYSVLRVPTGSSILYPYASEAMDLEVGARGWIPWGDLEISVAASYLSRSTRNEDPVAFGDRLESRLEAGGSLGIDLGEEKRVEFGGYVESFGGGETRSTLTLSYRFPLAGRNLLWLRSSVQPGNQETILYDVSLQVGIQFTFPAFGRQEEDAVPPEDALQSP